MLHRTLTLLTLAAFLLPATALAGTTGNWLLFGRSTKTVTGLSPGEWASWDPAANSDDSPILSIGNCENADLYNFADKDGDGTASTVAYTVVVCPDAAATLNTDTKRDNACATMEGTSAVAADNGLNGMPGLPFIRVEGDGSGSNATDARVVVKCSQPSR